MRKYFHDAARRTVTQQGEIMVRVDAPNPTKRSPRPRPRGWIVTMPVGWMSAADGPGAATRREVYSAARDTEERAIGWFTMAHCGRPEAEISESEYQRLRALYEAEYAASKRK